MQTGGIKDLLLALEKWDDKIRKHEAGTGAAMLNEATKKSVGSGASIVAANIRSRHEFFLSRCPVNSRLVTILSRLPFFDVFLGIWLTATSQSIRPL